MHVWFRHAEGLDEHAIGRAHDGLSEQERARATRFHASRDRRDYAVAHDLLRRALSRYHAVPPGGWAFEPDALGKPRVSGPVVEPALEFSLSHTRGFVACAIGRAMAIGVDVERTDRRVSRADLGRMVFSDDEAAALDALPPGDRPARLFELWTLKEAFVKATGRGLSQPVRALSFRFDGAGGIAFEPPASDAGSRWHLAVYAPLANARLAVAVGRSGSEGPRIVVRDDDAAPALEVQPARVTRWVDSPA